MKSKADRPAKTPLQFALDNIATPDVRELVLKTTHALVSTVSTQTMLRTGKKSAVTIAAEAKCFAGMLHELEMQLAAGFSAVLPPNRTTQYVRPDQIPKQ